MKVPFLSLILFYLLIITIHLCSCYLGIKIHRIWTKVLLMPILSLLYYKYTPKDKFLKKIFAAQIFGFLGDVALLCDNCLYLMTLGIAFFFIGHLLYSICFIQETGYYNYKKYLQFLILMSSAYLIYAKILFDRTKDGFIKGGILIPGVCYLLLSMVFNVASGVFAFVYRNVFSILVHIGTFVFTVSDYILVRKMFYENNKYYHVILMATYILGQNLIGIGMANKTTLNEFEKNLIIG